MALNKCMHPRNRYRTPPDFTKLFEKFQEFASIAKKDVNGKIHLDFKDPHTLRVLTRCLLQADFNLTVEIPNDRLVPTLPLRLNYILWLEDLLNVTDTVTNVTGIDIGTGACTIYPLLGAVKNKWKMLGTETDDYSAQIAQKNVQKNNLEHLIEIRKSSATLLQDLFSEDDTSYDFCMCNPPFYSSVQELLESRSPHRPPPKNGFTGSPQELITEGGELEFVRKIIAESKNLKNNIKLFTSMVGHKYNLLVLLEDLKSDNISHTYTEFCQGRVTRWGLAWTYQSYDIYKLLSPNDKNGRKQNTLKAYELTPLPNVSTTVQNFKKKLDDIFAILKINSTIVKPFKKAENMITLDIKAETNTWCNQRRKRRMLKRLEDTEEKKLKLSSEQPQNIIESSNIIKCANNNDSTKNTDEKHILDSSTLENNTVSHKDNKDPIVHALLHLRIKDNAFVIEAEFLDGDGGKQSVHEIIQYIRNNWK